MSAFRPFSPNLLLAVLAALAWNDVRAQGSGMWIDHFGGEQGLDGVVTAIAVTDSGDVYVGGSFTEAGGVVVNHIAKWTGTSWEGLGSGLNDSVEDIVISSTGALIVGGHFTEAGGQEARFVAQWNGERWEPLEGVHHLVYALAANDTALFAGGSFGTTNQGPASRLATWTGTFWREIGGGVECPCHVEDDAIVYALAMSQQGLYVGGSFLLAGGQPAKNIALWDGSSWHPLGAGVGAPYERVWSVAVSDSGVVYVGGDFTDAGGQGIPFVARWTGTNWEPLGGGVNGPVTALAIGKAGEVYAGGYFAEAGGRPANNIALWTGRSWEPLGSGVNDGVWAMRVYDENVYVGGYFEQAGGVDANHMALWREAAGSASEKPMPRPERFLEFEEVYPNPAVNEATIAFHLRQSAHVLLEVYNVLGQREAVLLDSIRPAGAHKVRWHTASLPAGSHVVRLQAGPSMQVRPVLLVR